MSKIILSVVLFTILLHQQTNAQSSGHEPPANNVIHGSLGTFVFIYSAHVSYDRLLARKDKGFFKSYYTTLRASINEEVGLSDGSATSFPVTLGFKGLTGKGTKHFEFGLGMQYYPNGTNNPISTKSTFSPAVTLGYRKQTTNGFMFRTGLGIGEWAYVGFGYSF